MLCVNYPRLWITRTSVFCKGSNQETENMLIGFCNALLCDSSSSCRGARRSPCDSLDAGKPPEYHSDWRLEDAQEAVILACSSLISVVSVDGSRIVEFSHFSVKEFLTSNRLSQDLSLYRILPQPAHTILAQACLCALLRLDDKVDKSSMTNFPLSIYAAQHWVEHAQFENVSSSIQELMEHYLTQKATLRNMGVDIRHRSALGLGEHMSSEQPSQPEAPALYYAALCGLHGAVEHLIASCSQDINSKRGTYGTHCMLAL
ncbi:hypothetical protein BGW80DRAFT_1458045 [Lactifluus volemus]|nr:hypothetical protein BGW80DRAFT_1458045 [Lactifluus volemus]